MARLLATIILLLVISGNNYFTVYYRKQGKNKDKNIIVLHERGRCITR